MKIVFTSLIVLCLGLTGCSKGQVIAFAPTPSSEPFTNTPIPTIENKTAIATPRGFDVSESWAVMPAELFIGSAQREFVSKVETKAGQLSAEVLVDRDIPIKTIEDFYSTLSTLGDEKPIVTAYKDGSVTVGNLFPSATRTLTIKVSYLTDGYFDGKQIDYPFTIHNGDGLKNKLLKITTSTNETVADIPLYVVLANNGLLDIVALDSLILKQDEKGEYTIPDSSRTEKLEAIAYNAVKQLLTIKGFTPDTTRIAKVTYRTVSEFTVKVIYPSKLRRGFDLPPMGFENWVTVSQPTIQLRPMENRNVIMTLIVPKGIKVDRAKWEFWLEVTERGISKAGEVTIPVAYSPRILVTMR